MELNEAFGRALKALRTRRNLTHLRFFGSTSRTYMSLLEHGGRCPTIAKISDLSDVLEVHPVSLLVECYLQKHPEMDLDWLFERIRKDLALDLSEPLNKSEDH